MYSEREIVPMLVRYFSEDLTEDDKFLLTDWLREKDNKDFFDKITADGFMIDQLADLHYFQSRSEINRQLVWNKIHEVKEPVLIYWRRTLTAAAAAAILIMCGVYFWGTRDADTPASASTNVAPVDTASTIRPGVNTATLQLANGKKIALDTVPQGRLANEGNAIITIDGKKISYETEPVAAKQMDTPGIGTLYNTVATAIGQTYELVLPDGTHVWLNPLSSVRYPVAFTGKKRQVEIKGEAYFEVAKDQAHPFIITVTGDSSKIVKTDIEVLGTHFNVNAYGDDGTIKTTLIEGQIMMLLKDKKQVLKPGQQAITSDKIKIVDNIDTAQIVAWKNGKFKFDNCDLPTVMNQLARWYNLKIEYPAKIPTKSFSGTFYRDMQLDEILKALSSVSNLQFDIKGRKVIIK